MAPSKAVPHPTIQQLSETEEEALAAVPSPRTAAGPRTPRRATAKLLVVSGRGAPRPALQVMQQQQGACQGWMQARRILREKMLRMKMVVMLVVLVLVLVVIVVMVVVLLLLFCVVAPIHCRNQQGR